jgi:hypothetical protein
MSLDKKVNWYEEELDHFYGHNNKGMSLVSML